MIYSIENTQLKIEISSKGAELQSIVSKETNLEYLWSGDAKFWGKKSPVLFPIVGGLKNNTFSYDDKTYHLNRHGFAREMEFSIEEQTETSVSFLRVSNEETWTHYPFNFAFSVRYSLLNNRLNVTYTVKNRSHAAMYFSVGGHPAFKVPLEEGTVFEDYFLQFSDVENADRWPLSKDGLIENFSTPALQDTGKLPLKKSLFYEDALVFKGLRSNSISILSDKTKHGLKLQFDGFPYIGIWNAKDADFVCIEPWCGIADGVNASGNLDEKEGIQLLGESETFERTWSVELF